MQQALKSDLHRARKMTEMDIELAASQDPDARPMSDAELSRVRWMNLEDFLPDKKEKVCLRLDRDVLQWFRQNGKGYQTKINAALRAYIVAHETRDSGGQSSSHGGY